MTSCPDFNSPTGMKVTCSRDEVTSCSDFNSSALDACECFSYTVKHSYGSVGNRAHPAHLRQDLQPRDEQILELAHPAGQAYSPV